MSKERLTPWILDDSCVANGESCPARVLFDLVYPYAYKRWISAIGFRFDTADGGRFYWSIAPNHTTGRKGSFLNSESSIEKCKEEADKKLLELGYELLTEDDMEKIELLR